jgi:hypothetical protein
VSQRSRNPISPCACALRPGTDTSVPPRVTATFHQQRARGRRCLSPRAGSDSSGRKARAEPGHTLLRNPHRLPDAHHLRSLPETRFPLALARSARGLTPPSRPGSPQLSTNSAPVDGGVCPLRRKRQLGPPGPSRARPHASPQPSPPPRRTPPPKPPRNPDSPALARGTPALPKFAATLHRAEREHTFEPLTPAVVLANAGTPARGSEYSLEPPFQRRETVRRLLAFAGLPFTGRMALQLPGGRDSPRQDTANASLPASDPRGFAPGRNTNRGNPPALA